MSSTTGIIKKEVKELLTLNTLVPVIIFALIFGMIGNFAGDLRTSFVEKPVIGLIDLDNSTLSDLAHANISENAVLIYNGTSVEEGITVAESKDAVALMVIPDGFGSKIMDNKTATIDIYWIMKGTGALSSISQASVQPLLSQVSKNLSIALVGGNSTLSPTIILSPIKTSDTTILKGREMVGITPSVISSVISSESSMVPIIIMMVIIMAGSMVITSMGSEKENKTLETLLTLPVSRTSIVFGKLVGAAIVGLVMAVVYMLGLGYYISSLTSSSSIDLSAYGLTIGALDFVLIGISLFLALFSALAMCMILGIFTKNYKASQMMIMPITFLAMIPMFVTIFSDFDNLPLVGQMLIFAIPFSHPMIAMKSLMFGDTTIVLAGIGYMAIFCIITMFIAVTLFKKDILLTGKVKNTQRKSAFPIASMISEMLRKK